MNQYTSEFISRFLSHVNIGQDNECWEWQKFLNKKGYGDVGVGKRIRRAHRVAYELFYGEITNELHVLHKCDNPACCNPNHLFLGTQQDNMQDKVNKNRQHHPTRNQIKSVKLTEEKVLYIRQIYATGTITQRKLAKQLGVCKSVIGAVVRRETWKDI